jgi:lysophospholipase L1-like esterase
MKCRLWACIGLVLIAHAALSQGPNSRDDALQATPKRISGKQKFPLIPHRKWDAEMAAFRRSDTAQQPRPGGILFLGSSSIRMWSTLATDFPGIRSVNRGFGGSHISDSVEYLEALVVPHAPRQVVFYAGGNDLAAHKSPEQVAGDFRALVEGVRARLPETQFTFISIAPNPARWAMVDKMKETNALVREFCNSEPGLAYVDVFSDMLGPDGLPRPDIFREDRLHMNGDGYRLWTRLIRPHLTLEPDGPGEPKHKPAASQEPQVSALKGPNAAGTADAGER